MAEITVTTPFHIRDASPQVITPITVTAGEDLTPGFPCAFDVGVNSRLAYHADTADADRQMAIGIFLDGSAEGNQARLALPGSIVTGYDLDPANEATHRAGNLVYTGAGGGVHDTPAAGSVSFGIIVPIGQGAYGILVLPPVDGGFTE